MEIYRKEIRNISSLFKNWKDKMQTHFKKKSGRIGLHIPEVKAKRDIYGKTKEGSAGNGLTHF